MDNYKRFIKYIRHNENGCWEWVGAISNAGYGLFTLDKLMGAHRASYVLFKGVIFEGLQIDHLCRNKICVNPDHLEAVTPRVNTMRAENAPATINSKKTHCYKGHELLGDNLYVVSTTGERRCKICTREAKRLRRSQIKPPRKSQKTHCKHGHDLSITISYSKSGEWYCKKCVALRQKAYKKRRTKLLH